MFLYLTGVIIFLICIHIVFNYNAKARAILKLPGPKVRFIIGNVGETFRSPVELFRMAREWATQYKDGIYRFHAFPVSAVNIFNPEDIEIITSNMKYHKKGYVYNFLQPWLQEGLLISNGPKWQKRRKILTSAFHFNVLQKYFKSVNDNDKVLIETLKKKNGEPVNIVSRISEYTLNTICESAMGTKLSEDDSEKSNKYKEAIYALGPSIVNRFLNIYMLSDFIYNLTLQGIKQKKYLKIVHDFTTQIIEKRKKAIKENKVGNLNDSEDEYQSKKKRAAMLDLLINVQKDGLIDDVGIQEEVDTFMFEGHDTTAGGITYTLLLLANYSDIQNKLVDELNSIFGNDMREATTDDLAAMKYLDLVIKESLRLYPPVPFIMREIRQPCKLSNYDIPANTLCSIHIYDLHRSEKLYKDPHKFDPDRFLPENSVGRHNYAYIPFSAGPRNCIGQKFAMMEMKSVLCSILRHFKLVPVTKEEDLCFTADIVLRTTNPIYVKFLERKED